jgi:hypothetical protein
METVVFHGWKFLADVAETRAAYLSDMFKGAEACNCLHCQNLVSQREREYPLELCTFLESVGVNSFKEAEVWTSGKLEAGYCFNAGWWHFIGEVEQRGESEFPVSKNREGESRYWHIKIVPEYTVMKFKGLPESPIIQIEYYTELPWVLNEAYPE